MIDIGQKAIGEVRGWYRWTDG